MADPTVCCVMLTRDRHELAPKAVACFMKQTYPNRRLLIYDTGRQGLAVQHDWIAHARAPRLAACTVGMLRNNANEMVTADIIAHWDDDDYSHPERLTEQVAFLQASGADLVGYNEMLFWDVRIDEAAFPPVIDGEAWLYEKRARSDYAIGTSLAYWRKAWEKKQFGNQPRPGLANGEDNDWIKDQRVESMSSFGLDGDSNAASRWRETPRMIARIHGRNTSSQYADLDKSSSWSRRPEWDERVKEILA